MNRQTVLITGASTGIGHATALHLAAAGYDLIAGVRREGDGQTLERSSGGRVTPVILDVTQPDHIERAVRLVRERSGDAGLKALVNNAGINHISPFELTDETRARQLF